VPVTLHEPTSLEELRALLAAAPKVRMVATRHSFNGIADGAEQVSLARMPGPVESDPDAGTVTCGGGMSYGELARALGAGGLALHNLASLPHISVAGAVATGTHGSGDGNGSLATAVRALELVTSTGEVVSARRGDNDFEGMVVGLGSLGAVTRVTLDAEPAYEVSQRVFEGLEWEALLENLDAIYASGYSVSVFTRWGETTDQVWVKSRAGDATPESLFGATPATVERHPILGLDPIHCTSQLGRPGRWAERLPHFRLGFIPSAGEELQSEVLLPRAHAAAAIRAVRELGDRMRPLLQVCELRTVASDRLWMSPMYERETFAIHFTWRPEREPVLALVREIEDALAALEPRPHWGKLFHTAPRLPRAGDFIGLAERLDPRQAFRNAWFERHVLG
jgi:xylitol oxidase